MIDRLLPDVDVQRIVKLLRAEGLEETDLEKASRAILGTAAHCRLAFASLTGVEDDPIGGRSMPAGAIISETSQALGRGRPPASQWAFWAAWLIQTGIQINGRPPTSEWLAQLVPILLNRQAIRPEDIRTEFVAVRRRANDCARKAADGLLADTLQMQIEDESFVREKRDTLAEGLLPDSHMPPMVYRGAVSEDWLSTLRRVRREILDRVVEHGPLGGTAPFVGINTRRVIFRNQSLTPNRAVGGVLHLNKGLDVATPTPRAGSVTGSWEFPFSWFDDEPYAATLYAVPVWWFRWGAVFVLRAEPMNGPKSHAHATAEVGDCRARSWRFF